MSESITPTRTYYIVFAALITLTIATVAVSFVELGPWHTTVGVLIGVVKASLVALVFMGLLHSSKASWMAVLAGLWWLALLMGLTIADYLTRQAAT